MRSKWRGMVFGVGLIDEKGKLFGLINLIDMVAFLLLILIVLGGANYYFTRSETPPQNIITVFRIPGVHPNDIGVIRVGDKLIANDSVSSAEIIKVGITPSNSRNPDSQGKVVLSQDPMLKDVFITAKDKSRVSDTTIMFAGQEVRIGKEFTFKTDKYEFKAYPQEINVSK